MYCCQCQSSFEPVEDCICDCHDSTDQMIAWAGAGDTPASLHIPKLIGLKSVQTFPPALDIRPNGSKVKGA